MGISTGSFSSRITTYDTAIIKSISCLGHAYCLVELCRGWKKSSARLDEPSFQYYSTYSNSTFEKLVKLEATRNSNMMLAGIRRVFFHGIFHCTVGENYKIREHSKKIWVSQIFKTWLFLNSKHPKPLVFLQNCTSGHFRFSWEAFKVKSS